MARSLQSPLTSVMHQATDTSRALCDCLRTVFLIPGWIVQGAFVEHAAQLRNLGADVREVRLPQEFEGLDGIVLPGADQ